jgi:hypothetical protein
MEKGTILSFPTHNFLPQYLKDSKSKQKLQM